jgi:hypothetical protein
MEYNIKNMTDITYKSELTQPQFSKKIHSFKIRAGLNSHSNLCSLRSISCVLI